MKAVIILCFISILQVHGFEKFDLNESLGRVQDQLLAGQRELSSTHEITQRQIYVNRNIISMYLELMNEEIIHHHVDTYAEMMAIAEEVEAYLEPLPDNDCVNTSRRIWALQIQRHGTFLAHCMRDAFTVIQNYTRFTDNLHFTAQATLNQVQNQGIVSLVERELHDSLDSFIDPIMEKTELFLEDGRNYMAVFEEFRNYVVDNEFIIIDRLTACDRALVPTFQAAGNLERLRAGLCIV